jgi:hypothetical protein
MQRAPEAPGFLFAIPTTVSAAHCTGFCSAAPQGVCPPLCFPLRGNILMRPARIAGRVVWSARPCKVGEDSGCGIADTNRSFATTYADCCLCFPRKLAKFVVVVSSAFASR